MLIDHIGAVLFPYAEWMRGIGRLAMPIYCFFIAEGMHYTKNRAAYLGRMLLFALLSELPFDLAFYGGWYPYYQNVLLTFALAISGIWAFEEIRARIPHRAGGIPATAAAVLCAWLAGCMLTDYDVYGVMLVYVLYFMRPEGLWRLAAGAVLTVVLFWGDGELFCLPAFAMLALYNGQRGRGAKYFFYIFYPAHLTVLYLIRRFLF